MSPLINLSADTPITYFLCGTFAAVFAASGLIFLKYWTKTKERFFLWFAVSCFLIAVERVPRALDIIPTESAALLYFIRLAGLMLIIIAIADANWPKGRKV